MLDLAKQSLVDEFVANCVRFLETKITAENLCKIYRMSIVYDLETVRIQCQYRIARNTKQIFATNSFFECDHEILLRILSFNYLNCTEMDVFNACIAWAKVKCKRMNLEAAKPEHLRTVLGDAVYQIRFTSMSIEEFAIAHKMVEGLFTHDEIVEILYMIGQLDGFKSQKFNLKPRVPAIFYKQRMDFDDLDAMSASYSSVKSTVRSLTGQNDWSHLMQQQLRLRQNRR